MSELWCPIQRWNKSHGAVADVADGNPQQAELAIAFRCPEHTVRRSRAASSHPACWSPTSPPWSSIRYLQAVETIPALFSSVVSMDLDPLVQQARAAEPLPPGRLLAIGDLHLSYKANREALEQLRPRPNDGLILCGDIGETVEHLRIAFEVATTCFRTVWWTPGNHELYTLPAQKEEGTRGEAKYKECVEVAREYGILTPEDDFTIWEGEGGPCLVAPIFTLYDYSFRPDHVRLEDALDWAREENIEATDEYLLHPDPYSSRIEWCEALVARAELRLEAAMAAHPGVKLIIAGHWPLRQDLVTLYRIPRFSLWCGTKKTEDWHKRFNARVVVSGHLHIRRTDWKDETRFEEVSFGYPRQWKECSERGIDLNDLLREILPGPELPPVEQREGTRWRRWG